MNTEEAFVLSSLKEFVKMWGSGCKAQFQLECKERQVWLKMSAQLGAPAERHFVPHVPTEEPRQEHHGSRGANQQRLHPRRKGPAQHEQDRARAAAHRANQQLPKADSTVPASDGPTAASADLSVQNKPPPTQPTHPPPAATAGHLPKTPPQPPCPPPSPATAAGHLPQPPPQVGYPHLVRADVSTAVCLSPPAEALTAPPFPPPRRSVGQPPALEGTFNEVKDEIHEESSEVKVFATGLFENCPDQYLTEDYFVSLRKFILSENHLQNNISDIKTVHLSSRQLSSLMFIHTVSVEISVKTARLWEPPRVYIQKHLANNDWLRSNKTKITLTRIHV